VAATSPTKTTASSPAQTIQKNTPPVPQGPLLIKLLSSSLIDAQAVKLEFFYIKEFLKLWFYTAMDENTLDHCTIEYFTRTAKLGCF